MMEDTELQPFVVVKHHQVALLFANYAKTQSLSVKVEENNEGFALLCSPEQLIEVNALFERFVINPNDAKYQTAAWDQAEVKQVSSSSPAFMTIFKDRLLAHAGFVTLSVFIFCWGIFILSSLGFNREVFGSLQFYSQLSFSTFLNEPYRLITPALFHFSLLHIAFNSLWWWQLGGDIEQKIGKGSLINLFLLSAIISNTGQFIVSGPNFGGLSGVVYALVGYVWWLGWLKPEKGLGLPNAMIVFLLGWLVLGFLDVLPINMANTAHLLGLITGCLMAFLNVYKKP